MGRGLPHRWSSTIVLLVISFQAITPDMDDLASSMAFRVFGAALANQGETSDGDVVENAQVILAGPVGGSGMILDRNARVSRKTADGCIGSLSIAGFRGGGMVARHCPPPADDSRRFALPA